MNGKNPRPRPYSPVKHDEGYSKIDWSKKGSKTKIKTKAVKVSK